MLFETTKYKNSSLILIAIIFALFSSELYSNTPSAPIWLHYTGVEHDTINEVYSVDLTWRNGEVTMDNPLPESYNIYRVLFGHSDDKFQLVGTHLHQNDVELQNFTDENIKDGAVYLYYVTAINNGNESGESKRMMAVVPGSYCVNLKAEIIDFESNPSTIGTPGNTYEYSAYAKHRSLRVQGLVRYELDEGPEGMEIDNETGLLTWNIPNDAEGEYYVKIKATSEDDKDALSEQEWYIRIASQAEIIVMSSVKEAVKEFKAYPLPAVTNLNVEFNSEYYFNNIELFDIQGNLVYSTRLNSNIGQNSFDINISNLSNGAYTLKISNDLGISTKKVVINK